MADTPPYERNPAIMIGKKVIVGASEWGLQDGDAADVLTRIKSAMTDGGVAELPLVDSAGRPVTVYVNGRTTDTVVVDLDGGPRPSEFS